MLVDEQQQETAHGVYISHCALIISTQVAARMLSSSKFNISPVILTTSKNARRSIVCMDSVITRLDRTGRLWTALGVGFLRDFIKPRQRRVVANLDEMRHGVNVYAALSSEARMDLHRCMYTLPCVVQCMLALASYIAATMAGSGTPGILVSKYISRCRPFGMIRYGLAKIPVGLGVSA
nr:hypothetical protein CFP56_53285 [Quercus suber]